MAQNNVQRQTVYHAALPKEGSSRKNKPNNNKKGSYFARSKTNHSNKRPTQDTTGSQEQVVFKASKTLKKIGRAHV